MTASNTKSEDLFWTIITSNGSSDGYQCKICSNRIGSSLGEARTHLTRAHKISKVHKCPQCAKRFQTAEKIRDHLKEVHKFEFAKEEFACGICAKSFQLKLALKKHVQKMHVTPQPTTENKTDEAKKTEAKKLPLLLPKTPLPMATSTPQSKPVLPVVPALKRKIMVMGKMPASKVPNTGQEEGQSR